MKKQRANRPGINRDLYVFLGDLHIPYQDQDACRLALNWIGVNRPGTIHLLGDLVDFYGISRFTKDPKLRLEPYEEALICAGFLQDLRKVAGHSCRIHYSEGNHERRLGSYIWKNAPALDGVPGLDLKSWLGLVKLGITWHPIEHPYQEEGLWVYHGNTVCKYSAYTAKNELDRVGGNLIIGHTHRLGTHYRTRVTGTLQAWENGCLCLIDPDQHRFTAGIPDWQRGFTAGRVLNGAWHLRSIRVYGTGGDSYLYDEGQVYHP